MKSSHSGKRCLHLAAKSVVGFFSLVLFLMCSLRSGAQSYFYFENKVPTAEDSSTSYFSFLIVEQDGNAVLRTRRADNPAIEYKMTDSVFADKAGSSGLKYLVPSEDPTVIGRGSYLYKKLRFIFKKTTDSSGSFYLPYYTEYKDDEGHWTKVENLASEEKTYNELLLQQAFVRIFYNDDDSFFKYLYDERDRAVPGTARKEKLYFILVANTNDASIGKSVERDFNAIDETFTTLAANLGMKIISTKISGNDFSKKNLDYALANLKSQRPSPIDIVIFYYSGHGFRYSNDVSPYPRMSLRTNTNQDLAQNNMPVEEVYKQIKKLGARLNLVISDCCNNDIGSPVPVGRDILKTRSGGYNTTALSLNMKNCKALFFNPEPISIIATSAEAKQLATANPVLGSFFTYYFKAFLEKSLYSFPNSDSWLRLFLTTKERARYQALTAPCGSGRCVQLAEIDVNPPR